MDLFKRIQDLSAVYDDDGPSATVPESRPMFNDGGMLVQPNADGSRPGYSGLPDGITKTPAGNYKALASRSGNNLNTTKKSLKEAKEILTKFKKNNPVKKRTTETTNISGDRLKVLNKYAQDLHGLNYKDLGPGQVQEVYNTARNRGFEYRSSGQDAFPEEKKNKIIKFAKEKNIKLDFDNYPKYGVPKDIKGKRNTDYTKLINFKNRGFEDFKKDLLSEADRIKVMDNFELPKGIKNWDFNNNKFGIPYTGNENISKRISNKLKEKKKYKVAADYSTPKGWMVSSMNRLYENEIKNKVKLKDLTYQPIKNSKGIIIGFKDNTEAGGGKKYYSIKKYQDEFGDGTAWAAHGDHERVKKFLNIAKGAQVDDPSKLLQKILDDKGITKLLGENRPLRLNDILTHERYFDKLSTTAPKKLIERQIVLHHTKGVNPSFGNAAATKDLQLLSGVVNQKVKGLEKFAKERKLTQNEITQLKNYGAKITDFDGRVVGGGFLDPERQFKTIEKGVIDYAKSDKFNVKTVASYLERLGCGKAAGGRVLFSKGTPEATLTKCAIKGQQKLNLGLTNGFSNKTEGDLAKKILQAGRGMGSMFALRNILGPAAVGFTVAAEAGLVGYDMLATGKSFKEAVGSSLFNYALGDKTQIDNKKLRYQGYADAGVDANQIGKISAYENAIDEMNNTFGEFNEENRLYNIAVNQKGKGRIPEQRFQKIKQQQAENFYNQADKNKALIQDLAKTQTEDRLDKAIDPMVPALMSDADAKRKAMQMTKPSTVAFGNFMDTVFPRGFLSDTTYAEDRDKAINYMPEVQEYYRGNQFAGGGIAGLSGGDPEGAMTRSMNPDSQGLQGLFNRVKKV